MERAFRGEYSRELKMLRRTIAIKNLVITLILLSMLVLAWGHHMQVVAGIIK